MDVFITSVDASGARVSSTYLGGTGSDVGNGIAVDANGSVSVTGNTYSYDFPVTAGTPARRAYDNAFVAKLNPAGTALVYSTYLGGDGSDGCSALRWT